MVEAKRRLLQEPSDATSRNTAFVMVTDVKTLNLTIENNVTFKIGP